MLNRLMYLISRLQILYKLRDWVKNTLSQLIPSWEALKTEVSQGERTVKGGQEEHFRHLDCSQSLPNIHSVQGSCQLSRCQNTFTGFVPFLFKILFPLKKSISNACS